MNDEHDDTNESHERRANEDEAVQRMTAAMREADITFGRVGGSTRHYVRDCLLPILSEHGLSLAAAAPEPDEQKCGWAMDDEGYYQTDCGTEFVPPECMSLEELPTVKYCANCGRRIRDDSPAPDADEGE